jgi:hypothetical protein
LQARSVRKDVNCKVKTSKEITHESSQEINEDEKPHRETTKPEQLRQKDQFAQIVDGGINPTTTLGEQNAK